MKGFSTVLRCLLPATILLFNPPAQAAPPAAPAVSVNAGVKQLNFLWNNVTGAERYELWFLPGTGGTWVKYAQVPGGRTSVTVNISAHFLIWNEARYQLKACNTDGCGSSPLLAVSHLMQQTVGFLKAPAPLPRMKMGITTDIGEWGDTLAAAIDADQSGGVDVFRKSISGWSHQARLLADPKLEPLAVQSDPATAVSANGDVIVLGVHNELREGGSPDALPSTGAVYVFRLTHSGWVREQKITFPESLGDDQFGWRVDLDESGTLLAAWRRFGDVSAGDPGVSNNQGWVELFKYTAGTWVRHATIPAVNTECVAIGLSGDGNTLARACLGTVEVFKAPTWQRVASLPHEVYGTDFSIDPRAVAINYDGTRFAVRSVTFDDENWVAKAWVNVYRLGASGWAREATLAPGPWTPTGPEENPHDGYGLGVAMSRDGRFLAVGAPEDRAAGEGAVYPPIAGSSRNNGAVYVYERKPKGWRLRQFIKPNASLDDWPLFGWSLSFARNGKDLAVGAYDDASSAPGQGPDPAQTGTGVVWLY